MKTTLKIVLPLLLLSMAAAVTVRLVRSRKPPEKRRVEFQPPLVRVTRVEARDLVLTVRTQGTVTPRAEGNLVPEVSGRVAGVSPSLVTGGFFEEGEVLITLDPVDFELALVRARARLAEAEARLQREEAEADVARQEWEKLGMGEPGPLVLREPQLAEARAVLASAGADLEMAERDLGRTSIQAPYAGRVLQEAVDIGEYAQRGVPLARIYAIDYAEIRIPIPDEQLRYIDLPLYKRESDEQGPAPKVDLKARFAGEDHQWEGRVVRTEGQIDPKSRMVTAVVRVDDPYGRSGAAHRPPLAVGLFVEALVTGHTVEGVVELPRAALRGRNTVYVVDDEGTLEFRVVEVLRTGIESVVIKSGLKGGEKVCLSPIEAPTDGMRVQTDGGGGEGQ